MTSDPYIDNLNAKIEQLTKRNLDLSTELLREKRIKMSIIVDLNRIAVKLGDMYNDEE